MRTPGVILFASIVTVAGILISSTVSAENVDATYSSQCVLEKAQRNALECPSGTEAMAGRGTGKVKSTISTSGRAQHTPQKQTEDEGPGVSDSIVQDVRSGFREKRQERVVQIIRQEIELTKRLIRNTSARSSEMPPRRLRLAQNYEELVSATRASVRELDEPIFAARRSGNKRQVQKLVQEQNSREVAVGKNRAQAIKQYAKIAGDFPDYQNRDEVLFRLAFMIEEQAADDRLRNQRDGKAVPSDTERGLRTQARRVYRELIKNYPNSDYIPNAYLSFAEYYFGEGSMENALEFYNRVVQYEDSGVYGYAIYKLAWVYINLQDDRQAVNQFVEVIQYAANNPDARIARPLARQAKREIITPFARAFGPGNAWEFFSRIGGDDALEMMENLAEHYYNNGEWRNAEDAYQTLMAENQGSHRLCFYQARVAECARRGRPKDEQVLEMQRTVDLMEDFLEGDHPAEAESECRQSVAQMILEAATFWHQEAVGSDSSPGTNDEETMEMASRLYALAIENFEDLDEIEFEGWGDDNRPTRYRVAYWAAELLWKQDQWSECGPAFDRVVELDPQGEYLREAAYAAVLCYNNLYEQQNENDRDVRAKRTPSNRRGRRGRRLSEEEQAAQELERLQPRELTNLEQGMLRAYTRYVCYVSDSDDLVRIKYRRARIYYTANRWEEAAALFRDIAYNHSEAELAPFAANQYLDCLNAISRLNEDRVIGCRDELATAVEDFLDNESLIQDEAFREQAVQLQCGILWLQAEARGEADRHREAAELFVRIYSEYRDECRQIGEHDICEVLYNAAINYEADYRIGPAIQIRRRLFQECGDGEESAYFQEHGEASPWAKKAIYQIGGNYHAIAAYTKAAQYYEQFADRYSGEEKAPEALQNATVFRLGLGQDEKAIANSEMFVRNYGRRREFKSQTATVVFSIGTIYMRREAWSKAESHYRNFIRRYRRDAGTDELIQAHTNMGYAQWMRGGDRNIDKAVREFRKATSIADRGRSGEETLPDRINRYKKMIGGGEGEEGELGSKLLRLVDSVAKARFYLGEDSYRDFMDISFPNFRSDRNLPGRVRRWWTQKQGRAKAREWEEMLRFLPPEDRRNQIGSVQFQYWVEKSFQPWMEEKDEARAEAEKLYAAAVQEDVPQWEIAAAARIGDMYQSYMKALYDAPIDPSIENDQELVDIYRDALDQAAQPYRVSAIKAFQHCLAVATKNRWFNEWSGSCEHQLNKLDPREYPLSDELRARPGYVYSPLAIPGVIERLLTQEEREAEEAESAAGARE